MALTEYVYAGCRVNGVIYTENPLYITASEGFALEAVYDKVESKIEIFEILHSTLDNDWYVLGYPIRFPTLSEAYDYVVNVLVPQIKSSILPLAIFAGSLIGIYYLNKRK